MCCFGDIPRYWLSNTSHKKSYIHHIWRQNWTSGNLYSKHLVTFVWHLFLPTDGSVYAACFHRLNVPSGNISVKTMKIPTRHTQESDRHSHATASRMRVDNHRCRLRRSMHMATVVRSMPPTRAEMYLSSGRIKELEPERRPKSPCAATNSLNWASVTTARFV